MRAGICGMAAPGCLETAAALAWKDGCISHANNGILGEVFNAVMTSLCFVEKDIRAILRTAISLIPEKYLHPAFDRLTTYMRGEMREITLNALTDKTVQAVISAI